VLAAGALVTRSWDASRLRPDEFPACFPVSLDAYLRQSVLFVGHVAGCFQTSHPTPWLLGVPYPVLPTKAATSAVLSTRPVVACVMIFRLGQTECQGHAVALVLAFRLGRTDAVAGAGIILQLMTRHAWADATSAICQLRAQGKRGRLHGIYATLRDVTVTVAVCLLVMSAQWPFMSTLLMHKLWHLFE
jgi:hypothetical protein